jgi:hypothetical protein
VVALVRVRADWPAVVAVAAGDHSRLQTDVGRYHHALSENMEILLFTEIPHVPGMRNFRENRNLPVKWPHRSITATSGTIETGGEALPR